MSYFYRNSQLFSLLMLMSNLLERLLHHHTHFSIPFLSFDLFLPVHLIRAWLSDKKGIPRKLGIQVIWNPLQLGYSMECLCKDSTFAMVFKSPLFHFLSTLSIPGNIPCTPSHWPSQNSEVVTCEVSNGVAEYYKRERCYWTGACYPKTIVWLLGIAKFFILNIHIIYCQHRLQR